MKFSEVVAQTLIWLQRDGRVSYRALKREFDLDDEFLEDLKTEIIEAKRLAVDENGKILIWIGTASVLGSTFHVSRSTSPVDSGSRTSNSESSAAERRQLTVMFCDLVGSTALSAQLDPEELRAIVRGYQETCTTVVQRYEGYIAQHLGDGLLVYFGYPVAHEDDAARAVRAGLEILAALQQAAVGAGLKPAPTALHLRIGIHTGLVVIGEIGSSEKREMLALGETPNIAARVQGQANPDEIVISAATYRLVEGLFACEDRGQPELKGVTTPLTLYRVVKEEDVRNRFEVVARRGLTPLIGREHEFGLLQDRWSRVKDGAGQVILLSGEPGIGKSRLVEALKSTVEAEGASFVELRCSSYTQNSALAPVIEHLQRTLQLWPEDTAVEKLQKLAVGAASRFLLDEHVPLLAALLSLPHLQNFPASTLSPQKQKEKTYEAVVSWLHAETKQQPVIYAWEDLHWADPSTLELLSLLLQQVPTSRVLAVFTYRPEFMPPWGAHSYLSQLSLSRLGRNHVEAMVEKVTSSNALSKEIVQQIVSKTDGVPLFVEELTKSMVESVGATGRSPLQVGIPVTLQDALMARLDRLGAAKEIAQVGATIGREFSYDLLQVVSLLNEETLQQGLKQLVDAELVFQSGIPPPARYLFKHALVQDTAYQSLLKSRRQQLHQTIGKVLEEQFPQTVEAQPELVAHHYTEAGLIEEAIPYWQRAGQRAVERSANVEAISHITTALEVLKTLPYTPGRAAQELTLQTILGPALMVTKGFGALEVEKTYARARELCQYVDETPQLFWVLGGLWQFYLIRAEYQTARELGEQLLSLAKREQAPALLLAAHRALGEPLFFLGELVPARTHLEQVMTLYDPQQRRSLAFLSGLEPGVMCLNFAAATLWYLGYPDQALQRSNAAIMLARDLSHPLSLAAALFFAAELHQLRRERQLTQERAEAAITLSTEQGFIYWSTLGAIIRGWTLSERGEEGITQIRQSIATWRATGAEAHRSYFLALLTETYERAGRTEEGLIVLAEALDMVGKTAERGYEAELHRLKGELKLQSSVQSLESRVKEAEECFCKAIDIARQQQAKSWELRASTSLARLWQHQGKQVEAHKLLSEVYNWFTEGFDTKDLQEAKALLDSLESQNV